MVFAHIRWFQVILHFRLYQIMLGPLALHSSFLTLGSCCFSEYLQKKHSIQEFNNILMPNLEKKYKEKKDTYLIGDFDINLVKYDSDNPTSQFLDGICSNKFLPIYFVKIILTRQTSRSTIKHLLIIFFTITLKMQYLVKC